MKIIFCVLFVVAEFKKKYFTFFLLYCYRCLYLYYFFVLPFIVLFILHSHHSPFPFFISFSFLLPQIFLSPFGLFETRIFPSPEPFLLILFSAVKYAGALRNSLPRPHEIVNEMLTRFSTLS